MLVFTCLSLFEVLKGTLKKFDFYRKRLLWQEEEENKKYLLVSWEKICRHVDQEGLGVMDLEVMNKCLLSKWLWKLETSDGMWQELLRNKYIKNKSYLCASSNQGSLTFGKVL